MPNKVHREGVKWWCCAESKTGYMLNWKCHTNILQTEIPFTENIVLDLLRPIPSPEGHIVFTDSFYSSIGLAKRLQSIGIGFTGSCRSIRKGLPEIFRSKQLPNAKNPGPFFYRNENGKGILCAMGWYDNKTVILLSTVYGIFFDVK